MINWKWEPGMKAIGHFNILKLQNLKNSYGEYDWPHDMGLRIPDMEDDKTFELIKTQAKEQNVNIQNVNGKFNINNSYMKLEDFLIYLFGIQRFKICRLGLSRKNSNSKLIKNDYSGLYT